MNNTEIIAVSSVVATLLTVGLGFYKYLDSRKIELKWKRTEFVFSQAKFMDTDEDILLALSVLCKTDTKYSVTDIFDHSGQFSLHIDPRYMIGFEKMLNLLDRLVYAYEAEVMTKPEIANFGMYFHQIVSSIRVIKFAESNGYHDVVRIADKLA